VTISAELATKCPHIPEGYLHMGALPCEQCGGYVDTDRTVMSAEEARAKYPQLAAAGQIPKPSPLALVNAIGRVGWNLALAGIGVALLIALVIILTILL
jgi:hypothetical protein